MERKAREEITLTVRDLRPSYMWMNNELVDDYLPIIDPNGYTLYGLYARRAMNSTQSTKLPQEPAAAHMLVSKATVIQYTNVLEWAGLIHVERHHRAVSVVYLLKVRPMTVEIIHEIRLRVGIDGGKLQKSILARLDKWQDLSTRLNDFVEVSQGRKIRIIKPEKIAVPITPEPTGENLFFTSPSVNPLTAQWQQIKAQLQGQMTQATFDTWVKQTELVRIEGNQWLIQCESSFAQDWLENRLNGTMVRTVASVVGHEVTLKFSHL